MTATLERTAPTQEAGIRRTWVGVYRDDDGRPQCLHTVLAETDFDAKLAVGRHFTAKPELAPEEEERVLRWCEADAPVWCVEEFAAQLIHAGRCQEAEVVLLPAHAAALKQTEETEKQHGRSWDQLAVLRMFCAEVDPSCYQALGRRLELANNYANTLALLLRQARAGLPVLPPQMCGAVGAP